jgi:hypothetical protein
MRHDLHATGETMLKTTIVVVLASLGFVDVARPQEPVPVPRAKEGDPCEGKGARITTPGGSSSTAPTTRCVDSNGVTTSCGYVLTYNPPVTTCVAMPDHCCLQQVQRSYTQSFDCQPEHPSNPQATKCVGGAKNYFGPSVVVDVTVGCTGEPPKCQKAGDY